MEAIRSNVDAAVHGTVQHRVVPPDGVEIPAKDACAALVVLGAIRLRGASAVPVAAARAPRTPRGGGNSRAQGGVSGAVGIGWIGCPRPGAGANAGAACSWCRCIERADATSVDVRVAIERGPCTNRGGGYGSA